MNEQGAVTDGETYDGELAGAAYRVLSVRVSNDTRAQLEVLAQLNDRSLTEEVRLGLEDWVGRSKSNPAILKRAEQVRAQIERDADVRRRAIQAVFGGTEKSAGEVTPKAGRRPAATPATTGE